MLVLVPTKTDPIAKKQSGKGCAIETNGTGAIKVIFALLAEMVILHMGLPIVEIGEPSLQLAFSVDCGFWTTALTLDK